MDVNNKA